MNVETISQACEMILQGSLAVETSTIVRLLDSASDLYYNAGVGEAVSVPVVDTETGEIIREVEVTWEESFISDDQYDRLELLLKRIDPSHEYFRRIGSDVRGEKVPLPFPMFSLDQVYEGDVEKWVAENKLSDVDFVISDKLDGASVALVYDKRGNFQAAYSRGNGTMGHDITRHIKHCATVPMRIEPGIKHLRAEAIVRVSDWDAILEEIKAATGGTYKNPRNYVSGRLNASERNDIFLKYLKVIITSVEDESLSKVEQLELARNAGFLVNQYVVAKGRELSDEFLTELLKQRKQESHYELDGIVLDIDPADTRNGIDRGDTGNPNPVWARKYKIGTEVKRTRVVKVHWTVSKNGYLKPRVQVDPVTLSGAEITYATGFNAKFIESNGIGPGAIISITRSGEVIPYITSVIERTDPDLPDASTYGSYRWTDGRVDIVLDDIESHPDVHYYRAVDFFARVDVPFLRDKSVEKLFEAGFNSIESIIKCQLDDLQRVLGNSAGQSVYEGLRKKLNPIDLATLAGASNKLGRGIGIRKVKKILDTLGTLDVSLKQLVTVEGFEEKTAKTVIENLPRFNKFLEDISGYYRLEEKVEVTDGPLAGVTVVFTGVRSKDLEKKIEEKAGKIGASINKNTTYLVCKDPGSNSSKMKKARELGVKIISLPEAETLWG